MCCRICERVAIAVMLALSACDRAVVVVEEPEAPEPAPTSTEQEREAVREAVRRYSAAHEARDGAAAISTVVTDTFDFYEDLRRLALSATREQLELPDLMTVILVLQFRASFKRSELEAANGRVLFESAVQAGLAGQGVDEIALDEVWIDDVHAEIRMEGEAVVWLREEDGQWRIDVPKMVPVIGSALEEMTRERILVDGKGRTAWSLIDASSETSIDMRVLDGPLE